MSNDNSKQTMRHELWVPYRAALEQIADAIAAIPLDVQLAHNLESPPGHTYSDFRDVFRARHPEIFDALEQAVFARNRASHHAAREAAKQRGIVKRKATLARKRDLENARKADAAKGEIHGRAR
jgi:hypothetical protein